MMQAWYYYRGKLHEVMGEHPGVVGAIFRGKARVRYHEDTETLAVQARSRTICRAAVNAYLDSGNDMPDRICIEWPGQYREMYINEWK